MALEYLSRLQYLIGEDQIELLSHKHVLICGVGGVGSFVAEALARSGIGTLTLVDFDWVDASNLNRQLMTEKENIGIKKTEALKKRLEAISDVKVIIEDTFIDENYVLKEDYDYAADCIDTLTSKFLLVKKCHEKKIPVISSMGTARRLKIANIKHTTLDKTQNDPLAKNFRSLVKKEKYNHKIEVVYADIAPLAQTVMQDGKTHKEKYPLGSAIFVVGSVGLMIANIIFNRLLEEKDAI